jgi:hypothetical protein
VAVKLLSEGATVLSFRGTGRRFRLSPSADLLGMVVHSLTSGIAFNVLVPHESQTFPVFNFSLFGAPVIAFGPSILPGQRQVGCSYARQSVEKRESTVWRR